MERGVAESLMKILAGGVRKAGGAARLLAAREARTKMVGNNEAAERTEIPGLVFSQEQATERSKHI